jgi:membrane associated rhomboid family serine protease
MILAGILTACAFLILLYKINFKRVLQYDLFIDIAITFFLMWIFAGTFIGMMAAIIGGLFVSIVLVLLKRTMPRQKLGVVKTPSFPYRKIGWITINPGS